MGRIFSSEDCRSFCMHFVKLKSKCGSAICSSADNLLFCSVKAMICFKRVCVSFLDQIISLLTIMSVLDGRQILNCL